MASVINKVGLLPFKKSCFICFNESLLKMMKNDFYFILKALFVLNIPSTKNCFICFNERPLKMMKNAFYFILRVQSCK